MSEVNKFKKATKEKEDLIKNFPVAFQPKRDGDGKWTTTMAEEINATDNEPNLQDYTLLHTQQKVRISSLLYNLLRLSDTELWMVSVLVCIVINYLHISYAYFFLRESLDISLYYTIVACDAMYGLDFTFATIIYFSKKAQLMMVNPPRTKIKLMFDSLLVFPYSFIYEIFYADRVSLTFLFLRSISFLRLYHLFGFFQSKSNSAGINHWKYFITRYFTYFFILVHALACIWYMLACPVQHEETTGWSVILQDLNLSPKSPFEWYVISMYFALVNITNAGFGDITATTSTERIVASLAMCMGFTLTTGVFIGTLSSHFVNSTLRKSLLRNQIAAIKKHLHAIGMEPKKVKHIMDYYKTLWIKKKGVRHAEDMNLLPLPLRMEICYDVNICLLHCSLIFRDKPEPVLRSISLEMTHEFYQPGDIIYHQHVMKYKMVFVALGVVEILSDEDNQSPIISFGAGSCLGEAGLAITLPAKATMRAANYTELQVLYKKDFFEMIDLYPEVFCNIRGMIFKRISNAKAQQTEKEEQESLTLSIFVSHTRQYSAIKKLKDRLNPNTTKDVDPDEKFYKGSMSLYKLCENVRKVKKEFLCMTANFPWIIHPNTSLTWTWQVVIVLNATLIAILYPYYVVFERSFPRWLNYVSVFMEGINLIDIYFILTTAIIEKDQCIMTFRGILFRQMNTFGFYLDVFSTFNIEIFTYLDVYARTYHLYYVLKLNRLLKCYRICKFFNDLEENLMTNIFTIRLIKYPVYLIMCPYWFGAILYFETCYEEVCTKNGWFNSKLIGDMEDSITEPCTNNPLHISVYYAMSCLSGLGYGDIHPGNQQDLLIVCFGVFIGIFVFGYCIAEFSATFTHNLKEKVDFQESYHGITKFMDEHKLNKVIKQRVSNFMLLQWYYNRGRQIIMNQSLFYNASQKIHHEVLIKERLETIMSTPMFQNTEMDFIHLIATGSRIIMLPPNEVITYAGNLSREMYIIQQGYCYMEQESSHKIIGPNGHFGIASIMLGSASLVTVWTITHVKIISIDSSVYQRAISMFPIIANDYQEVTNNLDMESWKRLHVMQKAFTDDTMVKAAQQSFWDKLKKVTHGYSGSFTNVRSYCRKTNEDYNRPFRTLGNYAFIKYLLVPICILPDGLFLKVWVSIRVTTAIMIALMTPYQQIMSPYFHNADILLLVLDLIAYVDIYLMMLVGYYGDKKQMVIHPLKTAAHYIKGLFLLDFVVCFPWEILLKLIVRDHNEGHTAFAHSLSPHVMHCIVRLIKVFQVYRLPKVFGYLEGDVTKKGDVLQIFKFVPITIVFINTWACIVIITNCKYYHQSDIDKSWIINDFVHPPGMASHPVAEYTMFCKQDSWIDRSKYQNFTKPLDVYIVAVYWCTTTLIGCGFGDITAQDRVHLLVNLFMIIWGVLFFGYQFLVHRFPKFFRYVFASISSHKAKLQTTLSHYQEMIVEFKNFIKHERVSKDLVVKAIDHCEYTWKRTRGCEPNEILANLHTALHEDAVLYMYEKILREVPLFENIDRTFFRILGKQLRERYYKRGQVICRTNDLTHSMHIIYRGKVEVMSSYNEMQAFMGIGGLFGNLTKHSKSKITVTITALSNVDTLILRTETFFNILKQYPAIKRKIEEVMGASQKDYIMPTMIDDTDEEFNEYIFKRKSDTDMFSQKPSASTETGTYITQSAGQSTMVSITNILLPNKWFKVAFTPDSMLFTVYSYISLIAAYINCLIVTYQFAFQHHTTPLLVFAIILDVIFILKLFLDLHKAYIDRYGEYITDNRKIRARYIKDKKRRILDFIAICPIYYLAFFLHFFRTLNPFLCFSVLRLITLSRFYYILEFYQIRSNKLMVNRLYLKITSIIMWLTLIGHIFACIWYLFACPIYYCAPYSWLTKIIGNQYTSKVEMYVACIYFMISVLTTTGSGDILPNSKIELIYISIVMVTMKIFIGVFIGDVTSVLNAYSSSLVSYEFGILELRDYLHNENVSEHQMEKMWNYVRQLWTRNNGKQTPRIFQILPYVMFCDIMHEIYGAHLRNSYLFSGTEAAFRRQLCSYLKQMVFFPGNYIVQHGDSDQSMYIIHRGEVDIITVHPNLTETIHDVLHEGEMFGIAQGLYSGVSHYFSFRARTNVDIISLQLNQWQDLLKYFPRSQEDIYTKAKAVYNIM